MVIISAAQEEQLVINVRVNGQLVLSTSDDHQVIASLEKLGIQDPASLLEGCRRWGEIEVRDSPQRDWRRDFT